MYAFAILMWEFITEKKPFDDITSSVMLCSRVHQGYRPSLDDIPKVYPNKLKDMMSSTWDKDRRERKSAIECFRILKFYHELMLDITYDVYLLNHMYNQNISNFIWHRLIQKGLNVKQCNHDETTGLEFENSLKAKVVIACLTKEFQNDFGCIHEIKHAYELTPRRLVIPLLLDIDAESWVNEDVYYYCQMRNPSVIKYDISQIVADASWTSKEGPDQALLSELHIEIDKLTDYLSNI